MSPSRAVRSCPARGHGRADPAEQVPPIVPAGGPVGDLPPPRRRSEMSSTMAPSRRAASGPSIATGSRLPSRRIRSLTTPTSRLPSIAGSRAAPMNSGGTRTKPAAPLCRAPAEDRLPPGSSRCTMPAGSMVMSGKGDRFHQAPAARLGGRAGWPAARPRAPPKVGAGHCANIAQSGRSAGSTPSGMGEGIEAATRLPIGSHPRHRAGRRQEP